MFQTHRLALRLSQSELARRSSVDRIRICLAEHGDCGLTPDEQSKIRRALQAEIDRIRNLPPEFVPTGAAVEANGGRAAVEPPTLTDDELRFVRVQLDQVSHVLAG